MDYIEKYISTDSMKSLASNAKERPKMPCDGCAKNRKDSSVASGNKALAKENRTGESLTGPVSIYAIAEMNKRAEEYTLKVRSELSRIGCNPSTLNVLRKGVYLQMKYQQLVILVSPQAMLSVLYKIPMGTELPEVWGRIYQHAHQLEKQKQLTRGWEAAVLVSLLLLAAFMIVFRAY